MRAIFVIVLGLAATASAYDCPDNSHDVYGPEYFGDCECDSGYEKKGYECSSTPTPAPTPAPESTPSPTPESTPSPTPAADSYDGTKRSCVGKEPWFTAAMGVWCTANCNSEYPYCPETHCKCSEGRRRLTFSRRRLVDKVKSFAECATGDKFAGNPYDPDNSEQRAMCEMFEKMDENGKGNGKVTLVQWRGYIGASNKAIDINSCDQTFLKVAAAGNNTNLQTAADCLTVGDDVEDVPRRLLPLPTDAPTGAPTDAPTDVPTDAPTGAPTDAPPPPPPPGSGQLCVITQFEFKHFWENPTDYASAGAATTASDQGSSGFSAGAVAGCVVAAVGAGIGVGYFAKGRESSAAASAKDREMRVVLSQGDSEL